jgi:hypothetical protein
MFVLVSGYSDSIRRETVSISLCAWSRLTPAPSFPRTARLRLFRGCSSRPWRAPSGSHRSALDGNLKPSGITPTMVTGTSLMRTARPTTSGLRPYRLTQTPWPIRATAGAPTTSSAAVRSRPSTGAWPRILKPSADMYWLYTEGTTIGRNWEGNVDLTWDGVLASQGRIVEDGWTVEAAIPFRTLRYAAGADRQ